MFWSSIIGGLKVLTFWEVYLAAIIFTIISVGPMVIIGLIGEKNKAVGCLGGMLIAPVFQALATLIFVFTLFPIILGFAEDAAWSFPWKVLLVIVIVLIIIFERIICLNIIIKAGLYIYIFIYLYV